jgi:hypothetical protein
MSAELQAGKGMPIAKLGEEQIGVLFDVIPGTIKRSESIPLEVGWGAKLFFRLIPGSAERFSVNLQNAATLGQWVIGEAGGLKAYDQKVRMKMGLAASITGLKDDHALVFKD